MKVHILTAGFSSPNGIAFLFPLHVHRRRLERHGVTFRCFAAPGPELTDCDALIVESRYYSPRWAKEAPAVLEELSRLGASVRSLLWFDISDSTGWLQTQVLPVVTRYYKSQLLKDRSAYLQAHYGNRIYADYYHRTLGITDSNPVQSRPVIDVSLLGKLAVSWNSGLADYSRWGPDRMSLRRLMPVDTLLRFPQTFTAVRGERPVPFAARFGTGYPRKTVSYQRERIRDALAGRVNTDKLSRGAYLEEMKRSRVVVSPFGYGEITLKDFEAALCGSLLLKPDMSHLETWPDLFRDGETMAAHRWDLSDFLSVLEGALSDENKRMRMAQRAQDLYRHFISEEAGYDAFCLRFRDMIQSAR
jgi:hypothetical protein